MSGGGTASDAVGVTQVTCTNAATGTTVTASGTTDWSCGVALVSGSNVMTGTAKGAGKKRGPDERGRNGVGRGGGDAGDLHECGDGHDGDRQRDDELVVRRGAGVREQR